MLLHRRNFLRLSALAAGAGTTARITAASISRPVKTMTEPGLPHASEAAPITQAERLQRIAKAQALMQQQGFAAIVLDAGTSLSYFTGINWWPSERTMTAVIPARGAIFYICPAFEEDRFRELLQIGTELRIWQEDENPFRLIVQSIRDHGFRTGKIGVEEQLRFFIFDGMRKEGPSFDFVTADPVTIPCRMIKSPTEIALMQKASEITVAAIKQGIAALQEGMMPGDFVAVVTNAHQQMGAEPDFALVNFAAASALPHGSIHPQHLKKGDMVLMDCGCRVHGYASDISRTIVFGAEPSERQRTIWNLEKKAQAAGFAAAAIGAPCENVDLAARKMIIDAGFGPGYKVPGLPHRTGHGIGMDGHEWSYMVRGNKTPLQQGMCFSIEPTISIPGEFGVRLEDCVYMTEAGPKWFSHPSPSIGQPFVA
ncbi:MAG TPA: Xaa-Pro peptidase family protein [Sediminibacterium sp.]|nr:Xaa-Pro peptidase family protein [Sediminibacterium sp.]